MATRRGGGDERGGGAGLASSLSREDRRKLAADCDSVLRVRDAAAPPSVPTTHLLLPPSPPRLPPSFPLFHLLSLSRRLALRPQGAPCESLRPSTRPGAVPCARGRPAPRAAPYRPAGRRHRRRPVGPCCQVHEGAHKGAHKGGELRWSKPAPSLVHKGTRPCGAGSQGRGAGRSRTRFQARGRSERRRRVGRSGLDARVQRRTRPPARPPHAGRSASRRGGAAQIAGRQAEVWTVSLGELLEELRLYQVAAPPACAGAVRVAAGLAPSHQTLKCRSTSGARAGRGPGLMSASRARGGDLAPPLLLRGRQLVERALLRGT